MKFKLQFCLEATILFWRKCATSCTCVVKKVTKLVQIFASISQGKEHKGKWTSFHLLPDLCPSRFSCCHVKLQTSVRSRRLMQFEKVNPFTAFRTWLDVTECSLPMYRMLYSFLQEFHLLTKLGVEQRSQCWHMFSFLKPGVGQNVAMHALPTVINVCSNFYLPSLFTSIFFPKPSPYIFYCISFGECSNCLCWLAETNNSSCLASQLTDAGSGGRGSKTYCNSESDVCLWFDRLFLPLLNPHSVCILCRVNIEIHVYTCFWPACICCWHWYCVHKFWLVI